MKFFLFVSLLLALCLSLVGCGGSGGTDDHAGPLTGVWSGTATRESHQMVVAWTRTDSNVTGVARLTKDGLTYPGEFSGTVTGNTFVVMGSFSGLTGTVRISGTFTTTQIQATIEVDEAAWGTMTLQRTGDNTAASVAGHYVGTWVNTTDSVNGTLTVDLSQDGNLVTGTWNNGLDQSGTLRAALIGNQMTAGLADTGGTGFINWSANLSGTTISGPFTGTFGTHVITGTFNISRVE